MSLNRRAVAIPVLAASAVGAVIAGLGAIVGLSEAGTAGVTLCAGLLLLAWALPYSLRLRRRGRGSQLEMGKGFSEFQPEAQYAFQPFAYGTDEEPVGACPRPGYAMAATVAIAFALTVTPGESSGTKQPTLPESDHPGEAASGTPSQAAVQMAETG